MQLFETHYPVALVSLTPFFALLISSLPFASHPFSDYPLPSASLLFRLFRLHVFEFALGLGLTPVTSKWRRAHQLGSCKLIGNH